MLYTLFTPGENGETDILESGFSLQMGLRSVSYKFVSSSWFSFLMALRCNLNFVSKYCSFENNHRLEGPELLGLASYDTNCS